VHPTLIDHICLLDSVWQHPLRIGISSGVRTKAEQRKLLKEGKTWTMDSDHLYGVAVDFRLILPSGKATWAEDDWETFGVTAITLFRALSPQYDWEWGAAKEFGGDWSTWNDMPHISMGKKARGWK